jgi:transposase
MFHRIRELKNKGLNKSQIAKELSIDPKTVRKYLKTNTPPEYKSRQKSTRDNPLIGFEDRVEKYLETKLSAVEVFELLVESGYKGSERTLNRFVSKFKLEKPKERFFEQEYEAGEQSQFDFKECVEMPFVGGARVIHLHFGTLPYSDTCFIHAYPFKNFECYMDGIHRFFEKIGGQTKNIRIDNLSPCVSDVLKGRSRKYTQRFERAIKYYGFGVLPCSPGKGNEKGDVERDIRTYSARIKNLVANQNIIFKNFDHLNDWLYQYMLTRQKQDNKTKLEVEVGCLQVLPAWAEDIICRIHIAPSSSFGTVRIGPCAYSVPDNMIKTGCRTVIGPYDVKIFQIGTPNFVVHPRKADGVNSVILEHVLSSLIRKPQALVRWAHREILFPKPVFKKFYDQLKSIDSMIAEQEFLKSINLVHHCPLSEIAAGMELVLEANEINLFENLRDLLLGERRPNNVIDFIKKLNQEPLKPNLSDYDELIPKKGNT